MLPPITKKQEEFLRADDRRINLLSGSVRSGKTYISLVKWALFVGMSPAHHEFLMCGKTLTALKRNCLNLLERLVGRNNFSYSQAQKCGMLFGRRVWLEGANDERSESKIRGMTLGGAYCDELTLIPQGFYEMLLSRLSLPGARLYATTNPDAPKHWVKTEIIDNPDIDLAVWTFLLTDNTFLDPEYVANLVREYTGVYYDRLILGRWVRAEGVIYPLFANAPERYVVDRAPDDIVSATIGVDFGGNKSASVFEAVGFTRGFKQVVALAEEHRPAATENPDTLNAAFVAFCRLVRDRWPMCTDAYCDSAEQVLMRGLDVAARRAGIPMRIHNARKGEINDRIRLINGLMGAERLMISRQCRHLTGSLQDAVWDEGELEDVRLDDGSYEVDPLDAFEYGIEPMARFLQMTGGGRA